MRLMVSLKSVLTVGFARLPPNVNLNISENDAL